MNTILRDNHTGFERLQLASEQVTVVVIPELGARLLSLRDNQSGRDWLWRPDGDLRLWRNRLDDPFTQGTFAGADECIPTIAPCVWQGLSLPDHGEAWSQAWHLDEASLSEGRIRLDVTLPRSPLRLVREIRLEGSVLFMDYELHNRSSSPQHWLWAWHPLLRIVPGDRLSLPEEVQTWQIESATRPDTQKGDAWTWPAPRPDIRLDTLDLGGDKEYVKAFVGPLREGRACVTNDQSQHGLELQWDTDALPYLGLWLTRGGFQGCHQLAIEPTNLPGDSLADTCQHHPAQPLPPRGCQRWQLQLRLF